MEKSLQINEYAVVYWRYYIACINRYSLSGEIPVRDVIYEASGWNPLNLDFDEFDARVFFVSPSVLVVWKESEL